MSALSKQKRLLLLRLSSYNPGLGLQNMGTENKGRVNFIVIL